MGLVTLSPVVTDFGVSVTDFGVSVTAFLWLQMAGKDRCGTLKLLGSQFIRHRSGAVEAGCVTR